MMPAPIQPLDGQQPAAVPAARACDVTKIYGHGPAVVTALDGVSVDIPAAALSTSRQATVAIPAGQLAIYILATTAAGVLASIGPARRAAGSTR